MEYRPNVTITFGSICSICSSSHLEQASASLGNGSLFPGGLHLTILAIYTLDRRMPIEAMSSSNSFPAGPTKGLPC